VKADDLGLVAALGVDSYRFSIEWARIEPAKDQLDEAAVAHYRDELVALRAMGIHPVDDWGTVNEPINYLLAAYGIGNFPPGKVTISQIATGFVPVVRDYLAAHAAMYGAIKAGDTIDADGGRGTSTSSQWF